MLTPDDVLLLLAGLRKYSTVIDGALDLIERWLTQLSHHMDAGGFCCLHIRPTVTCQAALDLNADPKSQTRVHLLITSDIHHRQ